MATVNLDRNGFFINIIDAQTPFPCITFSYDRDGRGASSPDKRFPVNGIYIGNDSVVTISYIDGVIKGIFPGKAANKIKVNIG